MTSIIATQEESSGVNAHLQRAGNLAQTMRYPHSFHQLNSAETQDISSTSTSEPAPKASFTSRNLAENVEQVHPAIARLEKILQLLPAGVLILDSRGQVSDCNPAAESMLDGAIKGKSWRDLIAEKFNPRLDDGHEISLKNGRRLSLLTRSLDDEPGQLIVLNDLTETRGLQQQISRNQRLSTMGKMISSLAHQIRTPLTAAMLYADKLLSGGLDSESVSRYGEKILSRLQNMERQIRDMLIFARGETELHDEVSVTELIARLREATADLPQAAAQNLIWKIPTTDIRLNCNSDTLIGALLNLIENALQASAASQQVTIVVELSNATQDHQSQRLRIAVEDQGSGIDAELLARLEEPFVTTKSQGTGLGLSIVRLVAKAHSGQFRLIPRPDKGVCAELILPVDTLGRV